MAKLAPVLCMHDITYKEVFAAQSSIAIGASSSGTVSNNLLPAVANPVAVREAAARAIMFRILFVAAGFVGGVLVMAICWKVHG